MDMKEIKCNGFAVNTKCRFSLSSLKHEEPECRGQICYHLEKEACNTYTELLKDELRYLAEMETKEDNLRKICPVMSKGELHAALKVNVGVRSVIVEPIHIDCVLEKCEWWIPKGLFVMEDFEGCAVRLMALGR